MLLVGGLWGLITASVMEWRWALVPSAAAGVLGAVFLVLALRGARQVIESTRSPADLLAEAKLAERRNSRPPGDVDKGNPVSGGTT
jgi:hypothetical protein